MADQTEPRITELYGRITKAGLWPDPRVNIATGEQVTEVESLKATMGEVEGLELMLNALLDVYDELKRSADWSGIATTRQRLETALAKLRIPITLLCNRQVQLCD